ncbi:MAG TPA: UvrB/UvrC motif-containing protein, partial [Candidatus Binataceae bacterium]|nr:UvrB/UvrC motif-containing protein [Candidatus Binataceae bacterium]
LRSARSLIQTIGRAARNLNGKVIMYADTVTASMKMAIDETYRRRARQVAYNEEHGITPKSIVKAIDASLVEMYSPEWAVVPEIEAPAKIEEEFVPPHELPDRISDLRREMMEAAEKLDYERAASLRDRIKRLERQVFGMDKPPPPPATPKGGARPKDARGGREGIAARDGSSPPPAAKKSGGRGKGAAASVRQGRLKLVPDKT